MASPLLRRFVATLLVLGFGVAAVVLTLSDRVPALVGRFGSRAVSAGAALERDLGTDLVQRDQIPAHLDRLAHAILWGVGMVIISWVLRRNVPFVLTALLLAAVSVAFEIAQAFLTSSRALEVADAVANVVGIGVALVLVVVVDAGLDLLDRHRAGVGPFDR